MRSLNTYNAFRYRITISYELVYAPLIFMV